MTHSLPFLKCTFFSKLLSLNIYSRHYIFKTSTEKQLCVKKWTRTQQSDNSKFSKTLQSNGKISTFFSYNLKSGYHILIGQFSVENGDLFTWGRWMRCTGELVLSGQKISMVKKNALNFVKWEKWQIYSGRSNTGLYKTWNTYIHLPDLQIDRFHWCPTMHP